MNTTTTFYIVRHGQSEGNIKKMYGLTPEVALSPVGKVQAEKLREELLQVSFAVAFSSDLVRARQTAEILTHERNLAIQMRESLRERHYGRMDGKTAEEMREELGELYESFLHMNDKDKYYYKLVPDMETVEEAVARFITTLREIAVAYEGKNILLVSHVTLMRGLLIHLGFFKHHEITSDYIDNAAYIKLASDGVDFFVKEIKGIRKKE